VVPEADAKLQGGAVSVDAVAGGQPDRHADLPPELRERRQPGAHPAAADQPQQHDQREPGQQLAGDHRLRRQPAALARIIAALDVSNATDVEVIPLRTRWRPTSRPWCSGWSTPRRAPRPPRGQAQGQADTAFRTTVIAEPRSNSLIVRAPTRRG
jgi:general secretion pathway protein D